MNHARAIEELRRLPPRYPFVSVYLGVQHDAHGAEAMRVFVRSRFREERRLTRNARDRERLDAEARKVVACLEDLIHGRIERASQGLAIFVCESSKLLRIIGSETVFENRLVVSDRPELSPLQSPGAASKRLLACLVDSRSARVLEVGPGGVESQAEIRGEVGRRHHQGGWSQMRFQRHVADQIDHHHREVATALSHLSDREPSLPIVLGGPETIVSSFRNHLPGRVRDRVVGNLQVALKAQEQETVRRVLQEFEATEGARREQELDDQVREALETPRGVQGQDAVLRAVNECAVERLFLADFDEPGWLCGRCGALGPGTEKSCPYCMGEATSTRLRSPLIENVLGAGGEVSALPRGQRAENGLAALLRFRS